MLHDQATKNVQPAIRQPYVTPQLIAYGLVRELTAGGSGVAKEGGAMIDPKQFP